MQMRGAALFFVKVLILITVTLTDGLSEVTPLQLLAWPDDAYDRYIAVDRATINGEGQRSSIINTYSVQNM